ncbi:DUF885 domain-containing protein [Nakamurella lactea]|uniref:DUF885 domain-containing protein n=1 Tax=Nakamurella lactea TaxID=459515 RepID=UPI0013774133|nr:DUF885 domain-containing protein [Nakamurella lactea]
MRGEPVDGFPTYSEDESQARAAFATDVLAALADIGEKGLDGRDADTVGFVSELAAQDVRAATHYWATPTATPYQLFHFTTYSDPVFTRFGFESADSVDRYVGLVRSLAGSIAGIGAKVAGQAARGFRIPKPALPGAVTTIENLRTHLLHSVRVDEERLGRLDPGGRGKLDDALDDAVKNDLGPAFNALLAELNDPEYRDAAPGAVGWVRYPHGDDAYRNFVADYTTTDQSPEDLHERGKAECAGLAERMSELRGALDFTGSEEDFRARLAAEPRLFAASPEEVEERYIGYMRRLEPMLGQWFSRLPATPYGVTRLNPALEASMTFGFYQPPTPAAPIGRYNYNASDLSQRSLLTAGTLIYHELAPGHHFHMARQREDDHLPPLRRDLIAFTAFTEGWAEYAAGLGWEMGLYDDPWDAYGRLAHERFTAQRLVVDTGLNLGIMSLEKAREFMRANTIESEVQIGTELLRYSTDLPGQALCYRAGYREFLRLREHSQSHLGSGFDVREFHEAVLGGGALPFRALERRVAREQGIESA